MTDKGYPRELWAEYPLDAPSGPSSPSVGPTPVPAPAVAQNGSGDMLFVVLTFVVVLVLLAPLAVARRRRPPEQLGEAAWTLRSDTMWDDRR